MYAGLVSGSVAVILYKGVMDRMHMQVFSTEDENQMFENYISFMMKLARGTYEETSKLRAKYPYCTVPENFDLLSLKCLIEAQVKWSIDYDKS